MKRKKKKPRPRAIESFNLFKAEAFKHYIKEMEERTQEFTKNNPNLSDVKFYLFQTIRNRDLLRDMIFNLTYFYDTNYTGNKDFIHIPDISTILDNLLKHPIMLATRKDENNTEEILGVCTVKLESSTNISSNPFFPTKNENVLIISNILTKIDAVDRNNNKIRGIGKELFKAAIKAAYELNKTNKLRLICEVDCRNMQSYNAVSKAVTTLKSEGLKLDLAVDGYYEIIDNTGELTEAPTFILEIGLNSNRIISDERHEFNYLDCKATELFSDLNSIIESNTKELSEFVNIKDEKVVIYHELEAFNALNVEFNIGNTAEGNERVPQIQNLQYQTAQNDIK